MSVGLLSVSSLPVGHCHLVYRQASSHLSWPAVPRVYKSNNPVNASNARLPYQNVPPAFNRGLCRIQSFSFGRVRHRGLLNGFREGQDIPGMEFSLSQLHGVLINRQKTKHTCVNTLFASWRENKSRLSTVQKYFQYVKNLKANFFHVVSEI